jgi:carbon-monoxide dehydrogenase medium subunit
MRKEPAVALSHDFEYLRPSTVGRAVKALTAHPGSRVLAGGTDLVGWLMEGVEEPPALVDIKAIPNLDRIRSSRSEISLGCLVTFSDLIRSRVVRRKVPLLWEMAGRVASPGIRNRATVAGNICSAVPCTDAGTCLLVYDAAVDVTGPGGKRSIPLDQWFLGPRMTALKAEEMALGVRMSMPGSPSGGCWVKLGRYRGEDLAQASVAVLAGPGPTYRVAFGAVAPRPVRAGRIESLLAGRSLTEELLSEAVSMMPEVIAPITDIRATADYRMEMAKVMLKRALRIALRRMEGRPAPPYGESVI